MNRITQKWTEGRMIFVNRVAEEKKANVTIFLSKRKYKTSQGYKYKTVRMRMKTIANAFSQ